MDPKNADYKGKSPIQPDKAKDSSLFSVPQVSLPKGGGAIKGIGEKFSTNPVTGTGSMSVPVMVTPGRSGFGPQLSLSYDSGSGKGVFGFGWNISLPSITRKTDKGLPRYRDAEESDIFILSGAEDLVPGKDENDRPLPDGFVYSIRRYRPRTEGLFARIERWTNKTTGIFHWRSISKDNITTLYGTDENSRIADPQDPSRIFSWLIAESHDDKGNAIYYKYKKEDSVNVVTSKIHEKNRSDPSETLRSANRYLKYIRYGNKVPYTLWEDLSQRKDWMFEVVFDYCEKALSLTIPLPGTKDNPEWDVRPDPFSSCRSGFEVRTYRLCHRILMFHHFPEELGVEDYLVRSMEFMYEKDTVASFISSIIQSGYLLKDEAYLKKSLPPLEFEYSKAVIHDEIESIDLTSLRNLPIGLDGSRYQWIDLDGEGISGIISEQGGEWYYKPNLGNKTFGEMQPVRSRPATAHLAAGHQQLMDLAGDGSLDLVEFTGPMSGYYERTPEGSWDPFRPFGSLPNIAWNNPNLKFVDLNGDGHSDVLVAEGGSFTWYPSLAETGFSMAETVYLPADEEKGPCLIFADGTQSVYLADLSGDGLNDMVRVRNGEVCYWPNLGYGRFGAKVTMDNSPVFDYPDLFDQKRIRLVDIDGSGTCDILYLHHDRVDVYLNQSGNHWGERLSIAQFPPIDDLSSVITVDLFGNGTGCLVWSSPLPGNESRQLSFIRLMGEQKPHLLTSTKNNLGAETSVEYESSIKFYLEDKTAGMPWVTRIPFPVHVVSRVDTYDRISRNRFVTRYSYHHGYYDGIEREFRGFGRVEQTDTEEFATLTGGERFPDATNIDEASHVPPVVTKTWYHTGAYLEGEEISRYLAHEYYGAPDQDDTLTFEAFLQEKTLPDTIIPNGLTTDEEREACRALRGSILRQEIYALDGSDKADKPYSISERNYTVRCLQYQNSNRHAVFFVHPRETIDYHCERDPEDPRISHAMTFEVDNFGNVLKSAAIGYGRKAADNSIRIGDQKKQAVVLVTYSENTITNDIDDPDNYRAGLPCETRTYELTGYPLPGAQVRYTFDSFVSFSPNGSAGLIYSSDLDYEATATSGNGPSANPARERRLIEHVRTLYRRNALDGLLGLGKLESLAVPGESYKFAFGQGLLRQVFRREKADGSQEDLVPDPVQVLKNEGGYVQGQELKSAADPDNNPLFPATDPNDAWWIPSGKNFYRPDRADNAGDELVFAKVHFFLPHRFDDPFGNKTLVFYDSNEQDPSRNYNLLITKTEDPLSNTVSALNDYRVMQPSVLTDPNGTVSEVKFDTFGLVVATALHKGVLGDTFANIQTDLPLADIEIFFSNPRGQADAWIGTASSCIIYDIDRFYRTGDPKKPPYAAAIVRERHFSDALPPEKRKYQVSFSYSDGFGREIQKKIQAEPGQVYGVDADPRWVGSGWTVFNNKGKPVRQYEPFFDTTHDFRFGKKEGVSPILFYDPVGRIIAMVHPNHTYEKVVFDPWQQKTYDVNDTVALDPRTDPDIAGYVAKYFQQIVPDPGTWKTWLLQRIDDPVNPPQDTPGLDPEKRAAIMTLGHADTPATALFDSLGRTFLTIADNGADGKYTTRIFFDIEGNQREITDARDRIVMRYGYDMLSNLIKQESMEAGIRWILNDAGSNPIRTWDSRLFVRQTTYDALRRPEKLYVTDGARPKILAETIEYGEAKPNPEATNHRLKPWRIQDAAGILENTSYDFKGNPESVTQTLSQVYDSPVNWEAPPPLENEMFTSRSEFDALNRPVEIIAPYSSRAGTKLNLIRPVYNEANLLNSVDVWLELPNGADPDAIPRSHPAVVNIDYNARGQRTLIEYGNSAKTTYTYDDETFRLIHLQTMNGAELFQDLYYNYDPTGNIIAIRDDARQTIFFNGQVVRPDSDYTYDAIYRLVSAHGREHIGQAKPQPTSWDNQYRTHLFHTNDGQKMRNYAEIYHYDEVGNFDLFEHKAASGDWTRKYTYDIDSQIEPGKKNNRLSYTVIHPDGANPVLEPYGYDAHGNMLSMPHLSQKLPNPMQWDYKDQLICTDKDSEKIYYVYDTSGQRVRKVAKKNNGTLIEERLYLGAGFEIFRRRDNANALTFERETLHVMDDRQRIVLAETRTVDTGNSDKAPRQLMRYQLGNHLGSAVLELNEIADVISYEEYYPYGCTSYQAVRNETNTPKRYRYTGKERDEETGLYYHGARYYAPWLGRWTSSDVDIFLDGINLFCYVRGNPIHFKDISGRKAKSTKTDKGSAFILELGQELGKTPSRLAEMFGLEKPVLHKSLTSKQVSQFAKSKLIIITGHHYTESGEVGDVKYREILAKKKLNAELIVTTGCFWLNPVKGGLSFLRRNAPNALILGFRGSAPYKTWFFYHKFQEKLSNNRTLNAISSKKPTNEQIIQAWKSTVEEFHHEQKKLKDEVKKMGRIEKLKMTMESIEQVSSRMPAYYVPDSSGTGKGVLTYFTHGKWKSTDLQKPPKGI